MRYRITIEVDVDDSTKRNAINTLANGMGDYAVTTWSNPVFISTEQVMATEEIQVLRQNKR